MFLDEGWFEDAYRALTDTLRVDARGKRDMIQFLLDEGFWDAEKLSWPAAEARFNACLNRHKGDAHFKLGELCALMVRFDRHQFFLWQADMLGYEVRRKASLERVQELAERALDLQERQEAETAALRAELQRLLDNIPDEAPKPAPRAGWDRPKFSRRGDF